MLESTCFVMTRLCEGPLYIFVHKNTYKSTQCCTEAILTRAKFDKHKRTNNKKDMSGVSTSHLNRVLASECTYRKYCDQTTDTTKQVWIFVAS